VKLEQEAKAHIEGTRIKFYDELSQHAEALEQHIKNNLWQSDERDKAVEHLVAAILWASHCAKKHGVH
jgi:hypothetical protein